MSNSRTLLLLPTIPAPSRYIPPLLRHLCSLHEPILLTLSSYVDSSPALSGLPSQFTVLILCTWFCASASFASPQDSTRGKTNGEGAFGDELMIMVKRVSLREQMLLLLLMLEVDRDEVVTGDGKVLAIKLSGTVMVVEFAQLSC